MVLSLSLRLEPPTFVLIQMLIGQGSLIHAVLLRVTSFIWVRILSRGAQRNSPILLDQVMSPNTGLFLTLVQKPHGYLIFSMSLVSPYSFQFIFIATILAPPTWLPTPSSMLTLITSNLTTASFVKMLLLVVMTFTLFPPSIISPMFSLRHCTSTVTPKLVHLMPSNLRAGWGGGGVREIPSSPHIAP